MTKPMTKTKAKTPKPVEAPVEAPASERDKRQAAQRDEFVSTFAAAIESGGGRECRRILGELFDRLSSPRF